MSSTFVVRDDWKDSPNRVSCTDEKDSSPNLIHDGSMASKILERLVCETSSEALPIIHRVHWIRVMTSDPGTTICGSCSKPASSRSCQAEVSG